MNHTLKIERRDEKIKLLRNEGWTYRKIGLKFGISQQRVRQIYYGIKSKYKLTPIENVKIWNKRKRESLGLTTDDIIYSGGGREFIREVVRCRDNHTCQNCKRIWNIGERRFDVHHLDEKHEGKSNTKGIIKLDKENIDKMITLCHMCHMNLDVVRQKMTIRQNN